MRLSDLFEADFGIAKLSPNVEATLPPVIVIPELNSGNNYPQYRFNTIMAAARAIQAGEVPFKKLVPWASAQSVVAYTKDDAETVRIAARLAGVALDEINDTPSQEPSWVNTVSPVANIPMTESRRTIREEENVPRVTERPDITQPTTHDPKTDITQVQRKVVVIYPGRFQPLHQAHQQVFRDLQKRYPDADVYIATSDKTDPDKSPFSFADKVEMARAAGIPTDKIVQVRNPYSPQEITSRYDPEGTVLLIAVGSKDMAEDPRFRFGHKKDGSPTYLQQYRSMDHSKTMDQHGYVIEAPTIEFELLGEPASSATAIRKAYRHANPETRDRIIAQLYDHPSVELRQLFDRKLGNELSESMARGNMGEIMRYMREFLAIAKHDLGLRRLPTIHWTTDDTAHGNLPTFGKFVNDDNAITISIVNRHPVDIMRTLAHELTHCVQNLRHELDDHSGETGSAEENQANAMAGIIMRHFDEQHPGAFELSPIAEGEIVQFPGKYNYKPSDKAKAPQAAGNVAPLARRPAGPDLPNFHAAKDLATQIFWDETSFDYTDESAQDLAELYDELEKMGYTTEDATGDDMGQKLTHIASKRSYTIGEDELLRYGDSVAEDQSAYLQAPLDPEGDTDGPGLTGDQVVEGEVIAFPRRNHHAEDLAKAKELAKEIYRVQSSGHSAASARLAQRAVDLLTRLGYDVEMDADDADQLQMVLTHRRSGVKHVIPAHELDEHIVKHGSGYRLLSKKSGKNLGTFKTRAAAEKHEREIQFFKRR